MHAIASAYLIRQAPGAERYDGATVRISRAHKSDGMVDVLLTERLTGNAIEDKPAFLGEYSRIAIARFARDHKVALADWNIRVDQFAYNPIDSGPKGTHDAVYNAITAAFAQWASLTVTFREKKAEP